MAGEKADLSSLSVTAGVLPSGHEGGGSSRIQEGNSTVKLIHIEVDPKKYVLQEMAPRPLGSLSSISPGS